MNQDTRKHHSIIHISFWLGRLHIPIWLCGIVIAVAVSMLTAWMATQDSLKYHEIAPFYYDSAGYRWQALTMDSEISRQGAGPVALAAIKAKDGLDLVFRVMFAPDSLVELYGHLVVLVPFMALFLFLVLWYIYTNTRSLLLGVAGLSTTTIFPVIFDPYGGIADYWKDNIAMWIVSSP